MARRSSDASGTTDSERDRRPYPDIPSGTDAIPELKHIIILMMQGHSYDNYFGALTRGDGFPLDQFGAPTSTNPTHTGKLVAVHSLDNSNQREEDPDDSLLASQIQWSNGSCKGFVRSVETVSPGQPVDVSMGYWTKETIPFYHSLAQTFPLASQWFSSHLGRAIPNRRFLVAGTANGMIDELPYSAFDRPSGGTIFDALSKHDISWANYHHVSRTRVIAPRLLGRWGLIIARRILYMLSIAIPFPMTSLRGELKFTADVYPLGLLAARRHLRTIREFFRAVDAGTLPSVSIVDPDFRHGSERNPQDIQVGEAFAAKVINRVMAGKGWPGTLLIWLYDNHGGYYDHVPPPSVVKPDDILGRTIFDRSGWLTKLPFGREAEKLDKGLRGYDRLGFRVPAVVVSPFAKPGYVSHMTYDHTSVLKLIERKWNLPPLTRRDAAALDPLDMVDLHSAPFFLSPPQLSEPGSNKWRLRPVPPVDAEPAFRIGSARDLLKTLTLILLAWTIGFIAFGSSSWLFQTIIVLILTILMLQGVTKSRFWEQWVFWRPYKVTRRRCIYRAIFALIALTAFSSLMSAELYMHGLFHLAPQRASGNILWQYTLTFFWHFIEAIPWVEITQSFNMHAPLEFSDRLSELFLILFRLLVLAPVLTVIVQSAQRDR